MLFCFTQWVDGRVLEQTLYPELFVHNIEFKVAQTKINGRGTINNIIISVSQTN